VFYDKWIVRWQMGHLNLPDLLREINFRAHLFLDIKSASASAADAVLDLYHDNESMMPPAIVSSQVWGLLDRIAAAGTEMRTCYSVGGRGQIEAVLRRAQEEPRPHGVSIRHTLLSPDVMGSLHGAGLRVYAWTVNTARRAEELRAWGVDALISDDLAVLRE
jgi:glycerophosphoryl diester phosphodiesterase